MKKKKTDYQKKINEMAVSFNLELVKLLRTMVDDITRLEKRISKLERKIERYGKKK